MAAARAAIVTGASSGIGLAIAKMLGEEGYALTVAARRAEKLQAAVEGLQGEGIELQSFAVNVADEAEIKKVVDAHRERYGRLDVLVNNAGVGIGATLGRDPDQAHRHAAGDQPALDHALLPRVPADAQGGRRRASQRAGREHVLDLRQARRGMALGVLRHQARRRRMDPGDEQGTGRRRASSRRPSARRSSTRR